MGAWGSGSFENDDALDFLAGLQSPSAAEALERLFDDAIEEGMQGEGIDASAACCVMAAAELVAAARGHAADDLPESAKGLLPAIKPKARLLLEKASSAVSYVLMNSELLDLWAESDDVESWKLAATGLITRLDLPERNRRASKKQRSEVTPYVCLFCGEQIAFMELVTISLRRPWSPGEISEGRFAHEDCLNARAHPRYLVQWWTPPEL